MKVWLTIEPTKEEIDDLLVREGKSKTLLRSLIDRAYCLMSDGEEVTLKITNRKYPE